MSNVEREELRPLVEQLPDSRLPGALANVRRYLPVVRSEAWPPPWFGCSDRRSYGYRASRRRPAG